jgi:hypothetical protein
MLFVCFVLVTLIGSDSNSVSNITQLKEEYIRCTYINAQEHSRNWAQSYLPVISQAFRVSLILEINNNSESTLHYAITCVTATARILLQGVPRLYRMNTVYSSSVQVTIKRIILPSITAGTLIMPACLQFKICIHSTRYACFCSSITVRC